MADKCQCPRCDCDGYVRDASVKSICNHCGATCFD